MSVKEKYLVKFVTPAEPGWVARIQPDWDPLAVIAWATYWLRENGEYIGPITCGLIAAHFGLETSLLDDMADGAPVTYEHDLSLYHDLRVSA